MFSVSIGFICDKDNIKNSILSKLNDIKNEGIHIDIKSYNVGDSEYIDCLINESFLTSIFDKEFLSDLNFQLSEIIADVIIKNWEERIIKKIIKTKYFYLNDKEKKYIKNLTQDILAQQDSGILQGGIYKATRKNVIMRNILEYLKINNTIIIDGFVNFRIPNYIQELEISIERAFESFLAEREYKEFIKLLKYFVDIQESKFDIINIKPTVDGKYILLDANNKFVNNEYFEELKNEIVDEDINHDDILISTLITIAPRKIVIHDIERFQNKELIKTINSVFIDRVIICSGCNLCDIIKSEKELTKI